MLACPRLADAVLDEFSSLTRSSALCLRHSLPSSRHLALPMASNNIVASPNPKTESAKPSGSSTEYQLRKYLLLLATLVATVTYAAGLNLPGGAWQDTKDGHLAGDPILQHAHRQRYLTFYYCNATAFAASLVVSLLLLVLNGKNKKWEALLRVVMVLDLLGLMGAYVAGSCRDTFTTIYSALLVCAVFAYIVVAFSAYLVSKYRADADEEQRGVPAGPGTGTHQVREELHEILMLLATFAVTITYVAGLNPPGGFWADTKDGHHMSDPVLQEHYSSRYQAFYVCNATAFVASLLIIILLIDKKLTTGARLTIRFLALYVLIIIALFGLMGAYAAGSCREVDDTTYVVSLIGAVLAYIFLQVALTKAVEKKDDQRCFFQVVVTIHGFALKCLKAVREFFSGSQHPTDGDGKVQTRNRNTQKEEAVEKARSLVMLLATLVVSITYQAGLDPPGGLWTSDGDDHKNGDPILLTTHPIRYKVFFYSNSAAFVASLIVILMVQSRFLLKRHTLEAAMILDLFGLISAYAAGSCRDEITSIYVVALAGVVLVYVVIHIVFFTLDHKDNHRDKEKLENRREVLLLLAILAATLTYQAGLTPPGGFWSENDSSGHLAGYPVLQDNYRRRYSAFFYCNATSFMSSVALIILLVNPNLYRPGIRCYALYVCMVAGMFGLMGAYAAGSSRDLHTSIYVLTLVIAVFAFVALEVVIFWVYPYLNNLWKSRGSNVANVSSQQAAGDITEHDASSSNQEHKLQESDESKREVPEAQVTEHSETGEKNMREYLMLLGVLAASVTYQTGLKPPGGLWQDNSNGHSAGSSILHYINKRRFHAFFYSNSTSFMASIVVIFLLLPWTLHKHQLPLWPMQTAILLDMLGLLGAYAAGSNRDWETSKNVIYLVIPVLAYIAAYAAVSIFRKKHKHKSDENQSSGNDEDLN
ncbi:hypothetical protein U9M48_028844 [Paspalum notatum var. saurae]|uniref:PGG domain-containing protein n=1 Tax=Paspalum notatum var. saurae TaxID=547442 RepID=A0AAQ3U1Y3_PASNO